MTQVVRHYGFSQVPRQVLRGEKYKKKLSLADKGLYTCIKDICGETGECFYSLRNLAEEIGTSAATLSRLIPVLRDAKLIYAEKKARGNSENKHGIWHIRIVDIWKENDSIYKAQDCLKMEQSCVSDRNDVANTSTSVSQNDNFVSESSQDCFNLLARIITPNDNLNEEENKVTSAEENSANLRNVPNGTDLLQSLFDLVSSQAKQLAEMQSQLDQLASSKQTPLGDTHANTPSPTSSTGPDTVPHGDIRDNPELRAADSGSHASSVEDVQDVGQQSRVYNEELRIAVMTTRNHGSVEYKSLMDAVPMKTIEAEQETLFEVPDSPPVMPPESMPWSAEKLVQITEAKRFFKGKQGKRFSEELQGNSKKTQRERQKKAAEKILSFGITEKQYVTAYNECNNAWWNAKGSVTVEIMAANTPRGVTRVIELLDQIESRGESNVISFQDRQTRKPTQSATEVTAKVSEEINNRNFEKMMAEYEALQGVR